MKRQNRGIRRALPVLLLTVLCMLLGGCMLKSPETLYALPKQSESYYNLQEAVDAVVSGSVRYCAPVNGENRQPVQMKDLNGDGKNEAIVFAQTDTEKPLRIFVFEQTKEKYELAATIEGSGNSFDSVQYAQVDGTPGVEIVVGRSISDQVLKSVSVYTFQQGSTIELLSANYSNFRIIDLDNDGRQDLFLVRFDADLQTGTAELYRYSDGMMVRDPELMLSGSAGAVRRMTTGMMDENVPAVFVASVLDDNQVVTDVFAIRDGVMQNVASAHAAASSMSVRNYYAYATDIDGDGLIELPDVQSLPDWKDAEDDTAFRVIQWYNLTLDGEQKEKRLTYHDYSNGFYVELDEAWAGRVTISVDETVRGGIGYQFNCWSGSGLLQEEIFTLYLFSGSDSLELAEADGRILLADKNDVSYAASLGEGEWARQLTEESLRGRFHFIQDNWNSGEM